MTIKAITFDFWSTLYKSKTVDFTKRLLKLKEAVEARSRTTFDLEQFKAAVKVARETWDQTWLEEHRTITAGEWLEIMLADLGSSLSPAHLTEIKTDMENSVFNDLPTLVPEAKTVLAELSADYQLAIISDTGITPGRVLRRLLKQDGIIGHFTQLTFSDEVGYSKPHPAAFLTTLGALGVKPQEAVHVGDLLRTDIAGAQGVGMRAVQYVGINHDGRSILVDTAAATVKPDAVIKNHFELKRLLQRWNGDSPE